MIIVSVICVVIGLMEFLFAYFIWKKHKFRLIAGYVEGSIREEDKGKYATFNGIMCCIYGILVSVYGFIFTEVSMYTALIIFFVVCFLHIVIGILTFQRIKGG